MGSHTDYNLGYVMTMTIDRDTWIATASIGSKGCDLFAQYIRQLLRAYAADTKTEPTVYPVQAAPGAERL